MIIIEIDTSACMAVIDEQRNYWRDQPVDCHCSACCFALEAADAAIRKLVAETVVRELRGLQREYFIEATPMRIVAWEEELEGA